MCAKRCFLLFSIQLRKLHLFSEEFAREASRSAQVVVNEVALSKEKKTIPPKDFGGIAGMK